MFSQYKNGGFSGKVASKEDFCFWCIPYIYTGLASTITYLLTLYFMSYGG